jgi:hypothetical protein
MIIGMKISIARGVARESEISEIWKQWIAMRLSKRLAVVEEGISVRLGHVGLVVEWFTYMETHCGNMHFKRKFWQHSCPGEEKTKMGLRPLYVLHIE